MSSFHVTTFGCQMNEHDSERMKGMLESLGYTETADQSDADLILFNTCSIREKADERFVQHLYEAPLPAKRPEQPAGGHSTTPCPRSRRGQQGRRQSGRSATP